MYLGIYDIDEYVPIPVVAHRFSSGAAYAATVLTYSIYEEGNTTGIDEDVDMTPATPFDTVVGFYYGRRQLTAAAGFERGKIYVVLVKATVDSVSAIESHVFQIRAVQSGDAYAVVSNGTYGNSAVKTLIDALSGATGVSVSKILNTALTETAGGRIAAAFKKFFDKASPTGTINSLPDGVPGTAGALPTTNGTKLSQTVDLTDGQSVAVSDKTGFSLASTGADLILKSSTFATAMAAAIWESLLTGITAVGSIGKLIKDYLDAAISTRHAAGAAVAKSPDTLAAADVSGNLPADVKAYTVQPTVTGVTLDEAYDAAKTAAQAGDKMNLIDAPNDTALTAIKTTIEAAGSSLAAIIDAIGDLPTTAPDNTTITAINDLLEDAICGLSALKTLIDSKANASSALDNTVWTNAKAAFLDQLISAKRAVSLAAGDVSGNLPADVKAFTTQPTVSNATLSSAYDAAKSAASQTSVNNIPTNPLLTTDTRLAKLDATITSRLASGAYTAPDNATIAAIASAVASLATEAVQEAMASILDKLDTMLEADGENSRFTEDSLYNAPAGGGGGGGASVEEIDEQLSSTHGEGLWGATYTLPAIQGQVYSAVAVASQTVEIVRGDTPRIVIDLEDDYSGWTAAFAAKVSLDDVTYAIGPKNCVWTDATLGQCYIDLTAVDTASVGRYKAEIELTQGDQHLTAMKLTLRIIDDVIKET